MRRMIVVILALTVVSALVWAQSTEVQFVFTSDVHYGLTRPSFRGAHNVDAHVVNAAMVAKINLLEKTSFPADGGRRSEEIVGPIDFVAVGGDIANRAEQVNEVEIQSASTSWSQFRMDYLNGLNLHDPLGRKTPLYVVP